MIKSNGGIIGPDNVTTGGAFGIASGVFKLGEVTNLIKESKWPGGGPEGHQVANSCRFDNLGSDSLTRTPGSDGDRQKWTTSQWIKRGNFTGQHQNVFTCGTYSESINIRDDDKVYVQVSNNNTTAVGIMTNRVIRDPSAWYNLVVACDTTQGTASNRLKLYINGVEETSFSQDQRSSITQNMSTAICGQFEHRFGKDEGTSNYYDGYLAEAVLIDGQALTPTSFGEFDSQTGIWVPKDVSGLTFGTNGFYLDFKDSSALGNDAAGSNNFTVNNLTSLDQNTDTCTTNFATLNLVAQTNSGVFLREGNTKMSMSSNVGQRNYLSTIAMTRGKWYFEALMDNVGTNNSGSAPYIGVFAYPDYVGNQYAGDTGGAGYNTGGYIYSNGGSGTNTGTTYTNADTIGCALDLDNNKIYWHKNGTYVNAGSGIGNPSTGANGYSISNIINGDMGFCVSGFNINAEWACNFGNPYYAISSGNTDGNGFGNFEYAVPTGFLSLNTKNLAVVLA